MRHTNPCCKFKKTISVLLVGVVVVTVIAFVVQIHTVENLSFVSINHYRDSSASVNVNDSELPFTLSGIEYGAPVYSVTEGEQPLELDDTWYFGGDYSQIGSFPLDEARVFGSLTETPNDLGSYSPAILQEDCALALSFGPNVIEGNYYEPQDGYGTDDFIVWRSGELAHSIDGVNDNWALQVYSADTDECVTIDTSSWLNETHDTPRLPGEIVPTFNSKYVCFASNVSIDNSWHPKVIVYDREDDFKRYIVADGSYPCASCNQVLYACSTEKEMMYNQLMGWDGLSSEKIFSIDQSNLWGISGIWSSSSVIAVSISENPTSIDCQGRGAYIGLWDISSMQPIMWVHVNSPSVIGSMNEDWFVWGSGSQDDCAGMYGLNIGDHEICFLGETRGYSRPKIAIQNNAVLLPSLKENLGAVRFQLGVLPSER